MAIEGNYPDAPLILSIKKGDEKALGAFYRENFAKIAHLVLKNSGSEDDAKDVYQEGMMEVILQVRSAKLDQLESRLSTYLYSVCHHKWIDRLRRRNKEAEVAWDETDMGLILDDDADQTPYLQALENVMGQIGDKCRDLLQAFYYEKLPMSQIAWRLGFKDDNSAKSQKNKCMDKARDLAKEVLKTINR
ncbi:MAG: sigma-70 family RNA polymerase sigma factor [Spirosomataceae bacterium]